MEDKLLAVKVELRPWTLNLNQDDLHKNRELPSAFVCFLGVPDSSLPTKGTAHRSVRGNPEVDKKDINVCLGISTDIFYLVLLYSVHVFS